MNEHKERGGSEVLKGRAIASPPRHSGTGQQPSGRASSPPPLPSQRPSSSGRPGNATGTCQRVALVDNPAANMHKYMNDIDLTGIKTLADFLEKMGLQRVAETLAQHSVSTLDGLCNLTPSALQEMGITAGARQRMLRAIDMLRTSSANGDVAMVEAEVPQSISPAPDQSRPQYNSTSSLYIDSTISAPNFTQVPKLPAPSRVPPPEPRARTRRRVSRPCFT